MDGIDVGPPKWRVCVSGLNRCAHEGMNDISNVKVDFKSSQWKCKYNTVIKLYNVKLL